MLELITANANLIRFLAGWISGAVFGAVLMFLMVETLPLRKRGR